LSTGDIADIAGFGGHVLDWSDDAVSFVISPLGALGADELGLTGADVVTLSDTAANIDAIGNVALQDYVTQGVDIIDASDNGSYAFDAVGAQIFLDNAISAASSDTVSLADTGANIAGLSAADFTSLAAKGFDNIDASDENLTLNLAQLDALATANLGLTAGDTVTAYDTGASFAALTAGQIAAYGAQGVDIVDASDNVLNLTVEQGFAGFTAGIELTAGDLVTVLDSGANIAGVDADDMGDLGEDGFDIIDATDNILNLSRAQADALEGSGVALTSADVITVEGDDSMIGGLSAGDISGYGGFGIDFIHATDTTGSVDVAQATAAAGSTIAFAGADTWTLFDTGANISALDASSITSMIADGIDVIDASDNTYSLAVDQYLAAAGHLTAGDTITLADAGATIQGLSLAQFTALTGNGIDTIDATNDVLTLNLAKLNALVAGEVGLTGADTVTARDTSAHLEALSTSQIAALGALGVDFVDASDDVLHLTVDQAFAGDAAGIELNAGDVVTILDTGANISGVDASFMNALGEDGFDIIDATDNAYTLNKAQADALEGSGIALTDADVVTVEGDDSMIAGLSGSDISGYAGFDIDFIHAIDGTGTVDLTQAGTAASDGIAFAADDTWTLSTSGSNISALNASSISSFIAIGIDIIDASDNNYSLAVDQYLAAAGHLTLGDTITLADTGAHIKDLSAVQFAALAANGIDKINATDNVLALTAAQFNGLGSVNLTGSDTVTIRDTGAGLATLNFALLAGKNVDAIDSTDNLLTLSYSQFSSLGTVSLAAGDTVTLADTSTVIQGLSGAQLLGLGGKGVDVIDTTDNVLSFTFSQFNNLGAVTVAAGDVFTLADTESHLEAIGAVKINQLNTAGVDSIDSTDGAWNMTATVASALVAGAAKATADDAVTVTDTGSAIAGLSVGDIGGLAAHNVDRLDASDGELTLTTSQFGALGTVTLTASDEVTLTGTGDLLATLDFTTLAAKNVDHLDASDDMMSLTVAQYSALGTVTLEHADTVTLKDTGAALQGLSASDIDALYPNGVDVLDSTTDLLTLSGAQFNALGEVGLSAGDLVTVADTGATLRGMDIAALSSKGVDRIDATDNKLTLNKAQVDALGSVALTQTDKVTMVIGEGTLEGLTAGQLAGYAALGVDIIDPNAQVWLDAAQVSAMINTGLKIKAADFMTLEDTAANITANLGALFGHLAGTGVDVIDVTDDAINLTVAQATVLNGVVFDSSDTGVTVADNSTDLQTLTAAQIMALGAAGVDAVDATDDVLSMTVEQAGAGLLAGLVLTAEDVVTLADTGATLAGVDAATLLAAGHNGVDFIDATDNTLSLRVDQYEAISARHIGLTAGDTVTLADTGAHLAAMGPTEIAGLAAAGIDQINITDDAMTISAARFAAFSGFTFGAEDVITVRGTNGAGETIVGGGEHDVLLGFGGNDVLSGGQGSDTLTGGAGSDQLTGGGGPDTFVFQNLSDSVAGNADRIIGLQNADVIDLSSIDADSTTGGNQGFSQVDHFSHHAGEMTVKYNAGSDLTVIKLDVDGDGSADGQIAIQGDHHDFTHFVL
jgi:hypothetical protein